MKKDFNTAQTIQSFFILEREPYNAALGTTQHSLTGTDRQRQTRLVLISRLLYKVIVVLDDTHKTQLDTQLHSCTFELLVVNGVLSVSSTGFALPV